MSGNGNWCLIESDPGVFTELVHKFGVTGVQVEELWSLDKEQFTDLKPVYGLVFLFKWTGDSEAAGSVVQDSRLDSIFFARQVINNACATQAIMSVLMNITDSQVNLGTTLQEFKEFCGALDPETKGLALSNSDQIRTVHNSFARQTLFEFDSKKADKDDDVFHFVSYIPLGGRIYELDGLKRGPVDHGPAGEDWTEAVRPVIEARMQKYQQGEIHFNLMALIQDRTLRYNNQLKALSGMSIDSQMAEVARIEMLLAEEENKRAKWKTENIRRRHNYLPLIMELLRSLASRGELLPIYQQAREKTIQLEKKKKDKKRSLLQ
jgi:ubiquitin carboxyl-terminal hydrolase L5